MDAIDLFELTIQDDLPDIERHLETLPLQFHGEGSLLAAMCRYHLSTGGKRLRALLPVMLVRALGKPPKSAYPWSAACEMLHNATLVHDDYQDGDTLRRGRPTIWKRFSGAQAINLGDAMLFYPLVMLRDILDEPIRQTLSRLLVDSILEVIDGQTREFAMKTRLGNTTSEQYVEMVARKTSALFRLPMVGALHLTNDVRYVDEMSQVCRKLGILFQIQDDVLDIYGDKGRAGPGSDIMEGKPSFLAIHSLETLGTADREALLHILSLPRQQTAQDDVAAAIELMNRAKALPAALEAIRTLQREIDEIEFSGESNLKELLRGVGELFVRPIRHLNP